MSIDRKKKVDSVDSENLDTKQGAKEGHLTVRAVLISCLVLIALAYMTAHSMSGLIPMVDTSLNVPSPSAVGVLLALLLMNVVLGKVLPKVRFKESENIIIYNMVNFGGVILQRGFVMYMVFLLMTLQMNNLMMGGIYESVQDNLSKLVIPLSEAAVGDFWMGNVNSVPWFDWLGPIIFWTAFYGVVVWVLICMAVIVYRQWNTVEHLTFPVALQVIRVTENTREESKNPIWRSTLLWIGIVISFFIPSGSSYLNHYFPWFPVYKPFYIYDIVQSLGASAYAAIAAAPQLAVGGNLYFQPITIGIMYFVGTDILFSVWFLTLVHIVYRMILYSAGLAAGGYYGWTRNSLAAPWELTIGGFMGLGLYCLWVSRFHIKDVILKAFSKSSIDDSSEGLSYKSAFWGLVIGTTVAITMATLFVKIQLIWSIMYFTLFLLICFAAMRIRGEGGFALNRTVGVDFQTITFGNVFHSRVSHQSRMGMAYLNPMSYSAVGLTGAITMESYKMADETGVRKRSMTTALIVAFFVAAIASMIFHLKTIYTIGGLNVAQRHFFDYGMGVFRDIANVELDGYHPNYGRLGFTLLGVGLALLMGYMRAMFIWWPLHPIGVAMATNDMIAFFWNSALLVWLVKVVVNRYGGVSLFRRLEPFFIGLVVGQCASELLFGLIGVLVSL